MQLSSVYLYEKIKEKYEITERGTLSGLDGYLRPFLYLEKKIVQKKHFDMGMFMWYRDMTKSGNRQF